MAKVRAIVWRHRWELTPLLLFVFIGGLQTLLLALHSAVPFGFRRFINGYIVDQTDLYWRKILSDNPARYYGMG